MKDGHARSWNQSTHSSNRRSSSAGITTVPCLAAISMNTALLIAKSVHERKASQLQVSNLCRCSYSAQTLADTVGHLFRPGGMEVAVRLATTGNIVYSSKYGAVNELRVWELRLHICQEGSSNKYFSGHYSMIMTSWMTQHSCQHTGMTRVRGQFSFMQSYGGYVPLQMKSDVR